MKQRYEQLKSLNKMGAVIVASVMATAHPAFAKSDHIGTLLREASNERDYRQPGDRELRRAEELFARTFKGEPLSALKKGWRELDFDLIEVAAGDGPFLLLQESKGHRTGRGFYLIRKSGLALMLQMPHSFKDEQTRRIGLDMAIAGKYAAAAWNTVPRWYDVSGGRIDADLAHKPQSYFTALTQGFLRAFPGGTVAQLHGFEKRKRKSIPGASADVIVSSGTKTVTQEVRKFAACLGEDSGTKVMIYPVDVQELGGTTNTVGRLMKVAGSSGFIHLEMSDEFRTGLRQDESRRTRMNRCLEESR